MNRSALPVTPPSRRRARGARRAAFPAATPARRRRYGRQNCGAAFRIVAALAWLTAAGRSDAACIGDCNGDAQVVIAELVSAVGITLGTVEAAACRAADRNRDHRVTVDELIASVASALDGCAAPAWHFTDVTDAAGLNYVHGYRDELITDGRLVAGGVAVGDYDGDGWPDLFVVHGDIGPDLLFHNQQDGTFVEVGASAGIVRTGRRGAGPTFADVDGDGWLDLLVLGFDGTPPLLYHNRGDGTFTDVTSASGLAALGDAFSAAFADYDRDGDLDLFVSHWNTVRPVDASTLSLWRNDGTGVFTDVSIASRVAAAIGSREPGAQFTVDYTFTPNFADLDGDGDADLLLAADFGTSRVLRSEGDGTFTDVTSAVISDENGMGAAIGDYDNDGDLDWFVSSIADPNGVSEGFWGTTGNRLYRNNGDGSFADATDAAGVRDGSWGWAATFADFDNDGILDLCQVNGYGPLDDPAVAEFHSDPTRLFVGRGDGTFEEDAAAVGAADRGQGRGVAAFDYDRDGDLDLLIANSEQAPRLLRNDGGADHHWLSVALRGGGANSEAIGARVSVRAGGVTQLREIRAGSNYASQDPAEAHFGLGDAVVVDVTVRWPDGATTELPGVAANQLLRIAR